MSMNVTQFVGSDSFNMARFNTMIQQINSGVNSEVSALTNLINSGAKIQTGSYVGTGTYGSSNPCTLTFDFAPVAFYISGPFSTKLTSCVGVMIKNKNNSNQSGFLVINLDNAGLSSDNSVYNFLCNFSGKTISYWAEYDGGANYQCNVNGYTYMYYAIG